ncbi:MAG: RDD family protein [Planctomycetota bacterium]|jgi:uncharacterized RDD family membrane protein YckC
MACTNHPEQVIDLVHCSRCGGEFCRDCVVELKGDLFCANCKREQVRDIQSGADGMALDLASIGKRFAAIFIDGLITGIPLIIVYVVYIFSVFERGLGDPEQFDGTSMSLVFIAGASVVNLIYEGMMLQARGQTLGKMALGIKVVTPDGEDISPGQAWGRALVRVIFNALQYISLVDYLPAFFSKEKKTVHDSVAKTRVVNWHG